MALGSSDAKRLLTSHRYNCDTMNNNNDIYLNFSPRNTIEFYAPKILEWFISYAEKGKQTEEIVRAKSSK